MNYLGTSTIYVSQKIGDAKYSGFSPECDDYGNGPVKSIEQAIEKICQMRVSGSRCPMTICLTDDEYCIDAPIDFVNEKIKSWYAGNDCISGITVEGYGNKRGKIVGGKRITGFKKDTFNGRACFSAHIPEVEEGKWQFTDLYVDGKRASLTRYPDSGLLRCIETENTGSLTENEIRETSKWFIAKKEDLENLSKIEDGIISYYHFWIDEHSPVESYDRETGKLVMKYRSRFLITNRYQYEHCPANLEYYIENIPECFKNPGEWYLDRATGMVYYMPENDAQTPENISVYAPKTDRLVNIEGTAELKAKNIRFKNIDFVCTKGDYASRNFTGDEVSEEVYGSDGQSVACAHGAVNVKFAHCCSFEDCSFENIGIHAIAITDGCDGIRIEGCRFYDIGAGGIKIFGGAYGDETLYTHHNTIKGCSISHCGRRYAAGCGILANHTFCNEISENEISYLDYSGISIGWVWGYANSVTHDNIIRKNHIHHIGMGNLSDMGGIYLLGKQEGTVVSENVIHDVLCKHYGGWGIYTDEGSSYMTIEKNIVYRTSSQCYHQHYGCENVVKNNIFALGGDALLRISIDEMHHCLMIENNVFVTDSTPVYLHNEEDGVNFGAITHNNIFYDISGEQPYLYIGTVTGKKIYLDEAKSMGFESNSVVADPELDESFNLKDTSCVYEKGFKKI